MKFHFTPSAPTCAQTYTAMAMVAVLATAGCAADGDAPFDLTFEQAAFDTSRLAEYSASWRRLIPGDDGVPRDLGCFTETFSRLNDDEWLHIQTLRQDETESFMQEVRIFDAATLRPKTLRRTFLTQEDGAPQWAELTFSGDGARGHVLMPDGQSVPFGREFGAPVYDGWVAGLLLAALDLDADTQASALVAIPLHNQLYRMNFTVVGAVDFELENGETVAAWEVDAEWIDAMTGSVSPGGADESGGAYVIAAAPAPGQPAVLSYINTSATILFGTCV